jgi:hypothetical protein
VKDEEKRAFRKDSFMKHHLRIDVSKKPVNRGIVSVRSVTLRERLMRFLLGDKIKLTVIVPGNSVKGICIREIPEVGGNFDEAI